jgi:hypothetical protein
LGPRVVFSAVLALLLTELFFERGGLTCAFVKHLPLLFASLFA